eukprot:TRINITY_DN11002_c0_g1_i10.p1 TRINITY_DN11002_c0_g1~~TRINITY_DN11002_c0_g1_i10.p1  ORF type:complete len:238 (-),score=24.28 TRINITY_DN11002_c0_g1_i10:91-804(-)
MCIRDSIHTEKVKRKWSRPIFRKTSRSLHSRRQDYLANLKNPLLAHSGKFSGKLKENQFDQAVIGNKLIHNAGRDDLNGSLYLFHLRKLPEVSFIAYNRKSLSSFGKLQIPAYNDYKASGTGTDFVYNFEYGKNYITQAPIKIVSIPVSKTRMALESFYGVHTANYTNKSHSCGKSKPLRTSPLLDKTMNVRRGRVRNKLAASFYGGQSASSNDFKQCRFVIKVQPKKTIYGHKVFL